MLFFATTVNYLDRQVLSLTWADFIAPEFHWTNKEYGWITASFSILYAVCMLFAGRFVDWMDTKKGFLWAIGIWSIGAILHAFCGIATSGIVAGEWFVGFEGAKEAIAKVHNVSKVINVSVVLFIFARFVLALGEAGNFPAAIKATAEYFPKKDRAFSTSIFNAGTTIGALAAPLTIPSIAEAWGWEMAFIAVGALGFIWMGFWIFVYKKPEDHPSVNKAELAYILQDEENVEGFIENDTEDAGKGVSFWRCLKYRQTWAFAIGKFMTDGIWWFFLFWIPAYLSSVYGFKSSDPESKMAIFVLYMIVMLSIIGGWLPSYFVNKKGMNPYAGKMRAMLIFAFFPLLVLLAQPLGNHPAFGEHAYWLPVIIIGIACAAHQSWSANIFSTVGDMFPKKVIATVIGIGGMAGGVSGALINFGSGMLFDFSQKAWTTIDGVPFLEKFPEFINEKIPQGFISNLTAENPSWVVVDGISTGYMIVFSICSVAYLVGWIIMKILVPKYKPITDL